MVKCFGCNQEWENAAETPLVFADRHSDKVYGLCFACRRHIAIGRAVERMPKNSFLQFDSLGDWTYDPDFEDAGREMAIGKTPLEALKGGKHEAD